jgi:P-type Ca2+ transporter type 2C
VKVSALLQFATIYIPFLNPLFKTEPLTIPELVTVLILSSAVFVAVKIEKIFKRKRKRKGVDTVRPARRSGWRAPFDP